MVDLSNVVRPREQRIQDTEYRFHEALIMVNWQLGTITSSTAETQIKAYLGKPDMAARSFRNYRNSLLEKKWLRRDGKQIKLLPNFDLHGKRIRAQGEIATVMITIAKDNNVLDTDNPQGQTDQGG